MSYFVVTWGLCYLNNVSYQQSNVIFVSLQNENLASIRGIYSHVLLSMNSPQGLVFLLEQYWGGGEMRCVHFAECVHALHIKFADCVKAARV